jgi:hypothetical protein
MDGAIESVFSVLSILFCVALYLTVSESTSNPSRPRPAVRKRIENLTERAVWPVRVILTCSGEILGDDDGLVWFRDGMLWFDGETTAFRLGVEDVLSNPEPRVRQIWSLGLADQPDYEVRFRSLRWGRRSGDKLFERLYDWQLLNPVASNKVILPPMSVKPGFKRDQALPSWLRKLLLASPDEPTRAPRPE